MSSLTIPSPNPLTIVGHEEGAIGDVGVAEDSPPSHTTPTFLQKTQPGTTEALLDENAYLRWWCQGERKGWVDKLLKEMQKD